MKSIKILPLWFLLIFVLSACSQAAPFLDQLPAFPGLPDRTATALVISQAESTISARQTRDAPTPTQTPRPTRAERTSTPTHTVIITPTVVAETATPTPLPTALISDDFSEFFSGWAHADMDTYAFGFANGGYFIFVDIPKATIWSARGIKAADIMLRTQASRMKGPDDGYYGLMCRQQTDGYNYYILAISSDGGYGIGKVVNGTLQFIESGQDEAGIIERGEASNRIAGDCIGDTLTLTVNDRPLLEVQDTTFKSGGVGLIAGMHSGTGLYVLFDNFIALEPQ